MSLHEEQRTKIANTLRGVMARLKSAKDEVEYTAPECLDVAGVEDDVAACIVRLEEVRRELNAAQSTLNAQRAQAIVDDLTKSGDKS